MSCSSQLVTRPHCGHWLQEARMKAAEKGKKAGRKLALELIEQLRTVKGNHGVHIMAIMWEKLVPKLVEEAGLLPRPKV